MAAKYGTPYFSNYINSDMKPSDVRSMCCRLRLDLRELRKQNGGNFGAGENTGSIGVVTINLPHIAYVSDNEDAFFNELEHAMTVAARSLDTKRKICTTYLERENSAYPYTKAYLTAGFKNHFSTIGVIGMNEACLNAKWLHKDLTDAESLAWTEKVLDFMRNKLSDFQEKYGNLFNLEATPAESTCYTLARMDRKQFPDIITAGKPGETPYYTNSSHLPVGKIDDLFEALDMEDNLQTKYTSGTVFHAFLGERLSSWKSASLLVRKIAENYKLPYFTLSPTYSVCADHGYINGEAKTCPKCGKPTEIYSRITGYYRPVKSWNAGKAQEFADRKTYVQIVQGEENEGCSSCSIEEPSEPVAVEDTAADKCPDNGNFLVTTKTCPNCKMVKAMLANKDFEYQLVDAEEQPDFATKYGIMQVPTMVVVNGESTEIYSGASNIIGYINKQ